MSTFSKDKSNKKSYEKVTLLKKKRREPHFFNVDL